MRGVTMPVYSFVIDGTPIPLMRPRFHNGRGVYDAQRNEKLVLGINLRNQHQDRPPLTGPIRMDITFFMPVPKTRTRDKKFLMDTYHIYKSDLSNMVKFYEDISQDCGILKDDCIIAELFAKKIYGEPRTEFTFTTL